MKQYKAVFLDWDDTIGDWRTAEHKALADIYEAYRLKDLYATFEDYLNAYKPNNIALWCQYEQGEVTREQLHLQRFLYPLEVDGISDSRLGMSEERLIALAQEMGADFLRLTNKYFCLLPDAEQVVRYLASRYPLTILSNGFKEAQHYKFEHSGLAKYFAHTLISEEVGSNKPQPEIFRVALERNGVTAADAVMIGDNYSSDIAGAKAAGIDQIWIRDSRLGMRDEEMTATYIVPRLTDVMDIL